MATLLSHTVKPAGGDFTSLDACVDHLVATHPNLVGTDNYAEIEISGDWSAAHDTAAVTINGLTLDATRYLSIYTDAANRADLSWVDSKYVLSITNSTCLSIVDEYVRVDGLQINEVSVAADYRYGVGIGTLVDDGNAIWLSRILYKGPNTDTYVHRGINCGTNSNVSIWNSIIYNIGTGGAATTVGIYFAGDVGAAYSTVAIGGDRCIWVGVGTFTAKNCYGAGSGTNDFDGVFAAAVNCASEDASSDDDHATDCLINIPYDTDTFVNVTPGSEDFHLAVDGLSPLVGTGVDTSGDAAPLNFTDDMEGQTRDATWDIGADAWYVAPATGMTNELCLIFEC